MSPPSDAEIEEILRTSRRIAVVGLSRKPERPSHSVAAYLQRVGYEIVPVHPLGGVTLGAPVHPDLRSAAATGPIDIVNIFRRSEFVPALLDDLLTIRPRLVWMQFDIVHEATARRLERGRHPGRDGPLPGRRSPCDDGGRMRVRVLFAALTGLLLATPAAAQKTEDEARLMFTVGLSYTGGTDLWAVSGQPILHAPPAAGSDSVDLARTISGSVGLVFSGMYFPKPALGLVGEAFFMGIGLKDQCQTSSAFPTTRTNEICGDINGSSNRSSAVLLSVGAVARIGGNQPISPYARAQVGAADQQPEPDPDERQRPWSPIPWAIRRSSRPCLRRPVQHPCDAWFVFGGGATAVLGKGWQLRVEGRDNLVQIATVAGPTGAGDTFPDVVNVWKNLFSVIIGVDVVLEKKRGHRY